MFPCVGTGQYVTVYLPASNVPLQLCEVQASIPGVHWNGVCHHTQRFLVQAWAANSCPARTALPNINTVSGNCAAGAAYNNTCTQACGSGYVQVSGSATAKCQGSSWDQPSLVCQQACPTLPVDTSTGETCVRTLFNQKFSTSGVTTIQDMWMPMDSRQAFGSYWFIQDGFLQSEALPGCLTDHDLVVPTSSVYSYSGQFQLTAMVYTTNAAGISFRVQDSANLYRFYVDVTAGMLSFDIVSAGITTTLSSVAFNALASTWYQLSVIGSGFTFIFQVNGITVMTSADRRIPSGYAGVYAQTFALFDNVSFVIPCGSAGCVGTTDQTCTFACPSGMDLSGPTTITCGK
jgi:hypothetical protein